MDVSETPKVSLSRRAENKPRLFQRAPHHQKWRCFSHSLQLILGDMSKKSKSQLNQPDLLYNGSRQTAHLLTQQGASAACLRPTNGTQWSFDFLLSICSAMNETGPHRPIWSCAIRKYGQGSLSLRADFKLEKLSSSNGSLSSSFLWI